nr:response regulator [Aureimonas populi]
MQAEATALNGVRVFIVEDESLVAMQLEDMLLDMGCAIAGMAMRVSKAQEMLGGELSFDVAILDVNIGGEKVYPVAELLKGRNVGIVFATGYGRSGVPEEWQFCSVLQKPYTEAQVEAVLREALQARRA